MFRFRQLFKPSSRTQPSPVRRLRSFNPEMGRLEQRELLSSVSGAPHATPPEVIVDLAGAPAVREVKPTLINPGAGKHHLLAVASHSAGGVVGPDLNPQPLPPRRIPTLISHGSPSS